MRLQFGWTQCVILATTLIVCFGEDVAGIVGPSGPQEICAVIVLEKDEMIALPSAQIVAIQSPRTRDYMNKHGYPPLFIADDDDDTAIAAITASIEAATQPYPCLVIWSKAGRKLHVGTFGSEAEILGLLEKHGGS